MNPLLSTAVLAANPGEDDPDSHEHVEVHTAYADLPKSLVVVNDLRDLKRSAGARGRSVGMRPWRQIVGITDHQTGTADFAADHPGLDDVPAHALIHRSGSVSLLHHPTAYVQHGHALNGGTIGIEVACRAAGTRGDASTFWRSPREVHGYHQACKVDGREYGLTIGRTAGHPGRWHPPREYGELVAEATDDQLRSLSLLHRYYVDLVAMHGGAIRGIWAHRQGDESRTTDPGSRIYAVAERDRVQLGLADVRDMKLGTGKTIPKSWRTA